MSALIGVLSSWDMLARNSDFSRFAFSSSRDCHWTRVFCSARAVVGDENGIGDVFEDEVQAVALTLRINFGQSHPLYLALELVGRAAKIRHVAQNRDSRPSLCSVVRAEGMG